MFVVYKPLSVWHFCNSNPNRLGQQAAWFSDKKDQIRDTKIQNTYSKISEEDKQVERSKKNKNI